MLTVHVSPSSGGIVKIDDDTPSSYPFFSFFPEGTSVLLEAVPSSGYRFNEWSEDYSGTANPITVTTDCDKVIRANFSEITHILTIAVNGTN